MKISFFLQIVLRLKHLLFGLFEVIANIFILIETRLKRCRHFRERKKNAELFSNGRGGGG